jgi:hypothetical protein
VADCGGQATILRLPEKRTAGALTKLVESLSNHGTQYQLLPFPSPIWGNGSLLGLVEGRVLAMQNRLLQGPLAEIVVQRCPCFAEEQRERIPVLEQIRNGSAQGPVGLDQSLVELPLETLLDVFHDRFAVHLVEPQTLLRREFIPPRKLVVPVDFFQGVQHAGALLLGVSAS